ncbi:leucine-rich repeat-containing protein 46 isoform X1 [Myotis yumanensis]|uniref:leucine-rich repeat-containing protein 46 isoform X1 n=1 Tax=Myotis yumanensis TaxID=159337 RepID=UPI0038D38D49
MPGAQLAEGPEKGEVCITEALITKRNLTFPEDEDLSEKMFHTIAELQTVRLDREGITTIKNLEGLQNLHSLYLQANKIQRIENLACVPTLRFLSLAGNRIRQVENLRELPYLQFLDLSENLIAKLELDEFPQSLLILNLMGNSCTNQDGYRKLVTGALPLLMDLDRQPVSERWDSDEEDKASDEEFPELSGPFRAERGAGAGHEQAQGAQAAGSPGGAPAEARDPARPHGAAPAAREAHGWGPPLRCHSPAGEGATPGACLLATSLLCHQEAVLPGFQGPPKHRAGKEGGQSSCSPQGRAGWGPRHNQNHDQENQEVKYSSRLSAKPWERGLGENKGRPPPRAPLWREPVPIKCLQALNVSMSLEAARGKISKTHKK